MLRHPFPIVPALLVVCTLLPVTLRPSRQLFRERMRPPSKIAV